ncbi:hypothetical protein ACROYT_G018934 [Oculina patagonica]
MHSAINVSKVLGDVGAIVNNTNSTEHCAIVVGPRQVTITIHVFTLLLALVGNMLLITAFVRMKEPIMLLIANMAASDLLVAIFLIPRLITREAISSNAFLVHGKGGLFLCKMCTFLSDISLSVSTQCLVLIAFERFFAVVYPVLYKNITVKIRRFLVASTWIMAMAIHAPYFYTFRLIADGDADHLVCQPNWGPAFDHQSTHLGYNILLYVTVLLIPLFVISLLYTTVVIKLRRDKMATNRTDNGARRNKERNRNLQRMVIATVTAFLICWTLYIGFAFLELFYPEVVPKCSKSFEVVYYVSRVLASSYCAVNPCICFIFVRRFSRELKVMCKRKRQQSVTTDRKARGESGSIYSRRIELRQSLSESALRMTSVMSSENSHSNVSTPSFAANRVTSKNNNSTPQS